MRQHLLRQHLLRQHLLRQHLLRQHLLRQHLLRQHLLRQHLLRQHLLWQHLLWQHVQELPRHRTATHTEVNPLRTNDALRHSPVRGEWCLEAFPSRGRMMPWGIPQLGANDALRHSPVRGEWCLEAFPSRGRMMPWGIPQLGENDALRHYLTFVTHQAKRMIRGQIFKIQFLIDPASPCHKKSETEKKLGKVLLVAELRPFLYHKVPYTIPHFQGVLLGIPRNCLSPADHPFSLARHIFLKWTNEVKYSTKVSNFSQYIWPWCNLLKLDKKNMCIHGNLEIWSKKSAYQMGRLAL